MIIIEGIDKLGKTTLANALVAELNHQGFPHMRLHMSKPPDCFDHMIGYTNLITPYAVWDRFHLGELAYRLHDHRYGEHTLTLPNLRRLEGSIRMAGGYIVALYWNADLDDGYAERLDGSDPNIEFLRKVNFTYYQMVNDRDGISVPVNHPKRFDATWRMHRPQIDASIALGPNNPFVTDKQIQALVAGYIESTLGTDIDD